MSTENTTPLTDMIKSLSYPKLSNLVDFMKSTRLDDLCETSEGRNTTNVPLSDTREFQHLLNSASIEKVRPRSHDELVQELNKIIGKLKLEEQKKIENALLRYKKTEANRGTIFDRMAYHESSTKGKSYDLYVEEARNDLNREIENKIKVYLDTKFWIGFRNAELGRETSDDIRYLYQTISELVESGKACCPLSTVMFVELLKQSDPYTRLATAHVMDKLSCGYTLRLCFDTMAEELYLFHKQCLEKKDLKERKNSFDRSCFVLGIPQIRFRREVANISEESISKASFDWFSQMSTTDFIEFINRDNSAANRIAAVYKAELDSLKTGLNKNKEAKKENLSYKDNHAISVSNLVKTYQHIIEKALSKLHFEKSGLELQTKKTSLSANEIEDFQDSIELALRDRTHNGCLPMFDVLSCIDAAILSQEDRKLKANDFDDFRHAAAAFSAFDVFLTEKSLHHLLTTKPSNLAKAYKVDIASKPEEATNLLLQIIKEEVISTAEARN